MTKREKLELALKEAFAFVDAAKEALVAFKIHGEDCVRLGWNRNGEPSHSKEFAKAKRKSMDLSEALIKLRSYKS